VSDSFPDLPDASSDVQGPRRRPRTPGWVLWAVIVLDVAGTRVVYVLDVGPPLVLVLYVVAGIIALAAGQLSRFEPKRDAGARSPRSGRPTRRPGRR
jgi:hypothetical protein